MKHKQTILSFSMTIKFNIKVYLNLIKESNIEYLTLKELRIFN